ncbi:MAG: hypothetical protein ACJ8AK_15705 [Gemmatimonadaceae bacterium]
MMNDRAGAPPYLGERFVRKAVIALVMAMLLAQHRTFASSYEADQQRTWLPASRSEAFTGEVTYDFDGVLNQTTAAFVAPLGKRDLLHRILLRPAVHTIVVSYQFNGHVASHLPDSVRVQLESDDYVDPASLNRLDIVTDPTLTIPVGNRIDLHSLSVSQHVELETRPRAMLENIVVAPDQQRFVRVRELPQARIRRRATAWLSACEFLSMINQTEIQGTVDGLDFNLNHLVVTGLDRFAAQMLPADAQRFIECAQ